MFALGFRLKSRCGNVTVDLEWWKNVYNLCHIPVSSESEMNRVYL